MKREILNFCSSFHPKPEKQESPSPADSYRDLSSVFFPAFKPKPEPYSDKIKSQLLLFAPFFARFPLPTFEIFDLPTNQTVGLVGMIEMAQHFSQDAINVEGLAALMGENKFRRNSEDDTEDSMYVTDRTGRIELLLGEKPITWLTTASSPRTGKFRRSMLINGAVVGVLGETKDYQGFQVETLIFLGFAGSASLFSPLRVKIERPIESSAYLIFVSGLELKPQSSILGCEYLCEFLKNSIFSEKCQRIVLMGSLFSSCEKLQAALLSATRDKPLFLQSYKEMEELVGDFERLFRPIVENGRVPVDLMPGPNDSESGSLPQRPCSSVGFWRDKAGNVPSALNYVSNPYCFSLEGKRFLGTSGQNIQEIKRYSDYAGEESLDLMESMLNWGSFCPKNSGGEEFQEEFSLLKDSTEEFPALFFAGNCREFGYRDYCEDEIGRTCRILKVPRFSTTNSCVLLGINNLELFEVRFGT